MKSVYIQYRHDCHDGVRSHGTDVLLPKKTQGLTIDVSPRNKGEVCMNCGLEIPGFRVIPHVPLEEVKVELAFTGNPKGQ